MQDLFKLERQRWQALSTGEGASNKFYRSILREDAIMFFPGGMLIDGKENYIGIFFRSTL